MIPNKVVIVLMLILSGQFTLAHEDQQTPQEGQTESEQTAPEEAVTQEDIEDAMSVLIESGVIEIKEGKVILKDPSVLDELRRNGRLSRKKVIRSSICI